MLFQGPLFWENFDLLKNFAIFSLNKNLAHNLRYREKIDRKWFIPWCSCSMEFIGTPPWFPGKKLNKSFFVGHSQVYPGMSKMVVK